MIEADVGVTAPPRELLTWMPILLIGLVCASPELACRKKGPLPATTDENQAYPSAAELTVRGAPNGAEVWFEGESLGPASRPVSLPYTVTPLKVTVKATGYESATVSVIPDRAREVTINLKRAVAAAPDPLHISSPQGN